MSLHNFLKFGPFRVDTNVNQLWREGQKIALTPFAVKTLAVLFEHHNNWLTYDDLIQKVWGEPDKTAGAVRQNISLASKALGEYGECIENQRNRGYLFNSDTLEELEKKARASATAGPKPSISPRFEIRRDISESLSRHRLALNIIDEYIELEGDSRGWKQDEVVFCPLGLYQPTDSFARLMEKYDAKPPIREYYSLQDVESRAKDDERKLIVYTEGSDWRHIFTLNEITKHIEQDEECRTFRTECEKDLPPGINSKLYRHVNCESLVVTSDNYVILGRRPIKNRSGHPVPFSPGAWTASLEEQMLRRDPEGKAPPDADLFACAERGVTEELKIPVATEATRLLSYGIEWGNFTAAFLFLVRTPADLETIMESWPKALDRIEAIALDGMPGDAASVQSALNHGEWSPSELARTWKGGDAIAAGYWHPTARARLYAYLRHLEHVQLCGAS